MVDKGAHRTMKGSDLLAAAAAAGAPMDTDMAITLMKGRGMVNCTASIGRRSSGCGGLCQLVSLGAGAVWLLCTSACSRAAHEA